MMVKTPITKPVVAIGEAAPTSEWEASKVKKEYYIVYDERRVTW